MSNFFLILLGKAISLLSKILRLGHGSTWPGHVALSVNNHFISDLLQDSQTNIVIIAGTNGKTTTARIITIILREAGKKVFQNTSGANLLNGIASSIIMNATLFGRITKDYGIFEVDENTLPLILEEISPHSIILLNLFRDQLDRYGEIDSILKKWKNSLKMLPQSTNVIINADDPQIAYAGKDLRANILYFGLEGKSGRKTLQHASDSIYCPQCSTKLFYKEVYYSHLGQWQCKHCKLQRPKLDIMTSDYPLPGMYNKYNTLAAILFAKTQQISPEIIQKALKKVTPAFGRQEKLSIDGKQVQIFLSKNPASFNQSLETIATLGAKTVLFVLNDRIPDGRDVSWIWDVDFEEYVNKFENIFVSGDRVYDMGLRLQYAMEIKNTNEKLKIIQELETAIKEGLYATKEHETLFVLPTYSAMLEVRKILTGRKIL